MTKPPELTATIIPLWERQDERKRISQTISRVKEWREQLKSAQTFVLSRTAEEYKDRQAEMFTSQMGAVDLCLQLLEISHAGLIMSPKNWSQE